MNARSTTQGTQRPHPPGASGVFRGYADPTSHFSSRLAAVQRAFAEVLDARGPGRIVVVDICAGIGEVVLPVIASHPRGRDVVGYLLELDPASLAIARERVQSGNLRNVRVIAAHAGLASSYLGLDRAHVVLMSGVLMHIAPSDRTRVAAFLPQICAPGAVLIWTIGSHLDPTRIARVRRRLVPRWLTLVALRRAGTRRHPHEVGIGRVNGDPRSLVPDARVFEFRPSLPERFPRLRALLKPVWDAARRSRARHKGTTR